METRLPVNKPPAIIYCRVATALQAELGSPLAAQEDRCRRHARCHGYEVVGVFADHVPSNGTDRPGLSALLAFVRRASNEVPVLVLVDNTTRLSRTPRLLREISNSIFDAGGLVEYLN